MKALSLFIILLLTGCAATSTDFRDRFAIANATLGDYFEFYYIPSQGFIADRTFVSITSLEDPSADSRRLAALMAEGESKLTKLAVSSPADHKASVIIQQASHLIRGKNLPHLELLYIGDVAYSPALKTAVETLGGQFYFMEF